MRNIKAVIFDLDGTLLDTLEDLTDSVNAALSKYGYPQKTIEQIRSYVGNGIRNLIQKCIDGGTQNPDYEKVFQAFREHYKMNCSNKTKPYDGVCDLIQKLKADGIKLAIVSNKADFAVKELNDFYFKEFQMTAIGEREGIARKPSPDTVNQALKKLQTEADYAVYVGDSEVDIQTAANAKMPCISVLWGFREKNVLMEHHAKYFAKTPKEVYQLLKTI